MKRNKDYIMNYDNVEPASEKRIAQIKEVAQTTEPYSWSNYDILSLIKVIERYDFNTKEIENILIYGRL